VVAVFIFVCDKLFDFVDCDALVDLSACASVFALMRADTSADCGERVFFLDKFQRFGIFAQRRKSYIALNRDVRGASGLTGSGAAFKGILSVFAIIDVPFVFAPDGVANLVVFGGFDGRYRAKFLAESYRVRGTVFNALTARDAVFLIDFGMVVAAFRVGTIEHRGNTDCKARARAAVADCRRFARSFEVGHLVHKSVFFGFFENRLGFFPCNLSCLAGFDEVFRARSHLDAHIVFKVSAAFVQQTP